MAYEKEMIEKTILDVSPRLLFRYGYKNLNLNDVAKEIGMNKICEFLHFHVGIHTFSL